MAALWRTYGDPTENVRWKNKMIFWWAVSAMLGVGVVGSEVAGRLQGMLFQWIYDIYGCLRQVPTAYERLCMRHPKFIKCPCSCYIHIDISNMCFYSMYKYNISILFYIRFPQEPAVLSRDPTSSTAQPRFSWPSKQSSSRNV